MFQTASDTIAFRADPISGDQYRAAEMEVASSGHDVTYRATGTCAFQLNSQNTGHVDCEANADGKQFIGVFEIIGLKQEIGKR
jgi:hypothetical protein